jgi:hypothetical protein
LLITMQSATTPLYVQLKAISPVAFSIAREGDKALIKHNPPKLHEYRDKIGPASESYLVFKGETKLGMIPHEYINKLGAVTLKKMCRVARMDRDSDVIVVEVFAREKS